jgi:hypothetical protein
LWDNLQLVEFQLDFIEWNQGKKPEAGR